MAMSKSKIMIPHTGDTESLDFSRADCSTNIKNPNNLATKNIIKKICP